MVTCGTKSVKRVRSHQCSKPKKFDRSLFKDKIVNKEKPLTGLADM